MNQEILNKLIEKLPKKKIPVVTPHHNPHLSGYNEAIQDQISHLETQNKLIEEDKNI